MHGNLELIWGHGDIKILVMTVPSFAVDGGHKVSKHPVCTNHMRKWNFVIEEPVISKIVLYVSYQFTYHELAINLNTNIGMFVFKSIIGQGS